VVHDYTASSVWKSTIIQAQETKWGLTTIYEKSLASSQSGSSPLVAVFDYANRSLFIGWSSWIRLLRSGIRDRSSRRGCNIVLFSTGRGSVFALRQRKHQDRHHFRLFEQMHDDMDFNAEESWMVIPTAGGFGFV